MVATIRRCRRVVVRTVGFRHSVLPIHMVARYRSTDTSVSKEMQQTKANGSIKC